MDYKAMGERIQDARRQRGLTQVEAAKMIGISHSFMGHIERGTRVCSLETLLAVCRVFDLDLCWAVHGKRHAACELDHRVQELGCLVDRLEQAARTSNAPCGYILALAADYN